MDYLVECRLRLPEDGLAAFLPTNLVLCAFAFPHDMVLDPDELQYVVRNAVTETQQEHASRVYTDIEAIEIRGGSIDIILWLNTVASILPQAAPEPAMVGALGLWVADKALGGALSEFGKTVAQKIYFALSKRFAERDGGPPFPPTEFPVRDIALVAKREAEQAAAQHGCKLAILEGGIATDSGYSYKYELMACRHRFVTVFIDPFGKRPPRILVQ